MHTVISAFDDLADAQRAMDRLVERGFSRDMVHLQGGYSGSGSAGTGGTAGDDESHGFFHSISRFFSELFGSADDATHYTEAVRRGGTVLIVDAVDHQEAERARSVMEEMGGTIDLQERASQWRSEGWSGYDVQSGNAAEAASGAGAFAGTARPAQALADPESDTEADRVRSGASAPTSTAGGTTRAPASTAATTGDEAVMPVVREELQVGKREVERGGVRVVRRVVETPVREMIRLREERARVEPRLVDRSATEADLSNLRDQTVEVRETAEEAVVAKNARVVEEVVVGKDVPEREQAVEDTVRRTEVEVEPMQGDRSRVGSTGMGSGTTGSSTTGSAREGLSETADRGEGLLDKAGRKIREGAENVRDSISGDDRR